MGLRKWLWAVAVTAALLGGAVAASQQTATASTAQTATVSAARTATATATRSGTAHAVIPFIQFRECSNQTTTWVDLDLLTSGGLQDWCFGYTGTWYFYVPTNNVTFLCSGNNYGYYYYTRNGVMQSPVNFGPGYNAGFASNDRMKSLTITGWSGSYRCRS